MKNASVDLVFFWVMVFIAFAVGMICHAWVARVERREHQAKLRESARLIGQVYGLAMQSGLTLPTWCHRKVVDFIGSLRA